MQIQVTQNINDLGFLWKQTVVVVEEGAHKR